MRTLSLLTILVIPATLGLSQYQGCLAIHKVVTTPKAKVSVEDEKCLATMIYGEARGESTKGMIAVAYSAINRAKNKTICQVVLAPKQYSIFNDNPALQFAATTMNVEPKQKNSIDTASWEEAQQVAYLVMRGKVMDPTSGATHYIAPKVMKLKSYRTPRWAKEYTMVATIENHVFYKQVKKV